MTIETKFDIPLVAGLALREKQIQQHYRPIIAVHKWFARRPSRHLIQGAGPCLRSPIISPQTTFRAARLLIRSWAAVHR